MDPVKHNHLTRDIKPPGSCPKCDERRQRIADRIMSKAHMVFTPEGVPRWISSTNPKLGGTPAQALADGRYAEVEAVLDDYLDPSFT